MSLALYRTYRPGRLDDVVGQEHVTQPLRRALANGRVHHAFLFSGPRGTGKTSTARILARSLNCVQGPTPDPCGECQSCQDLAPNGPGSIDVIELDAASHGGVDDTRELRERAMFAPAASRFKVYIIDEAHMVTTQGFNALLKLVEEPPPHVRFVFATTEVEKVLPTIRSRTHNYTFRLVPVRTLQQHLARVCDAEGVAAEPAALALVARAGAGSVRDALSVLGQLVAGSGPQGLTYADAVRQLGVTDAALLDATVDALAAADGVALFEVVERVVAAGHDPRRFVTDLLERLRDLVVLHAVPGAADSGLVDAPDDQLARMAEQAAGFGPAELSRAADLVSSGLSELRGATAPRLQLELLCARLLLPAADDDARGLAARLDRLERRMAILGSEAGGHLVEGLAASGAAEPAGVGPVAAPAPPAPSVDRPAAPRPPAAGSVDRPTPSAPAAPAAPPGPPMPPVRRRPPTRPPVPAPAPADESGPATPVTRPTEAAPAASAAPATSAVPAGPAGGAGALPLAELRALWPAVLEAVKAQSRVAWMVFAAAAPLSCQDGVLAVAVPTPGAVTGVRNGGHDERLRQAMLDVARLDLRVDVIADAGAAAVGGGRSSVGAGSPAGAGPPAPAAAPSGPAGTGRAAATPAAAATVPAGEPDLPSPDDPDLDPDGLTGIELAVRELGATPIGEIESG